MYYTSKEKLVYLETSLRMILKEITEREHCLLSSQGYISQAGVSPSAHFMGSFLRLGDIEEKSVAEVHHCDIRAHPGVAPKRKEVKERNISSRQSFKYIFCPHYPKSPDWVDWWIVKFLKETGSEDWWQREYLYLVVVLIIMPLQHRRGLVFRWSSTILRYVSLLSSLPILFTGVLHSHPYWQEQR